MVIPPLPIVLWYHKLSETAKGPLMELFETKVWDMYLWYPPRCFFKIFAPDRWAAPETSRKKEICTNPRRTLLLFFRYCDTKSFVIFCWYPPMVHQSFGARQMSSLDFDLFSACCSLRSSICQKESSQFTSAVFFLFQKLRKSLKLPVWDLLASCIILSPQIQSPQFRTHQILRKLVSFLELFSHLSFCLSHRSCIWYTVWFSSLSEKFPFPHEGINSTLSNYFKNQETFWTFW